MNYHVGMYNTDASLKAFLVSKNIKLQAWSPLGDGKGKPSLITGNMTNGIGEKHNKTGAQVRATDPRKTKYLLCHLTNYHNLISSGGAAVDRAAGGAALHEGDGPGLRRAGHRPV